MIECKKCGNKEHDIDFIGNKKKTIYFTEIKQGYKCHGCDEVIKDVKGEFNNTTS